MKNLDRFERMVGRRVLRTEHAWMVGVITKYQKSINGFRGELSEEFLNGYNQACEELYARLKQRMKKLTKPTKAQLERRS